jgi:hypothetical protein
VIVVTSDSVFSSVVGDEHDGKRLKWYLRHLFGKDAGLSKQQCKRMIKIGCVALNRTVVVDSGRFLHAGDKMIVLPETSTADGTISESVVTVEIHRESENVVVAFNPVGMGTIGSFSAQTLEMVVSAQTRESFKAVSKLDTGCCGLCVLSRDGTAVKEVSHVFTALVHGRVPDSWNGLSLPLPIESMRRWRKSGHNKQEEHCGGSHVDDDTLSLAIEDTVMFSVLEKTPSNDESPALPTLKIVTASTAGGLCNAISFLLRKRGHPVVNDRLCHCEYLTLPRSIRNLIKNRLCIGCL